MNAMKSSDKQVFAFSDTHIGASYANHSKHQEKLLREGIKHADIVVICGDAFEFTQPSVPLHEQVQRATQIMARWQHYNKHAEFHFIAGNHEAPRNFAHQQPGLAAIQQLWPELRTAMHAMGIKTHEEYYRLGDTIFAHGHIDTCKKHEQIPKPIIRRTYHHVGNLVAPGTLLAQRHFPMERVLPALHAVAKLNMQRDSMPDDGSSNLPPQPTINHLIFGHTHDHFMHRQFPDMNGLSLGTHVQHHNLGCSVARRPDQFQPICFVLDGKTGTARDFQPLKAKLQWHDETLWQSFSRRPSYAPALMPARGGRQ